MRGFLLAIALGLIFGVLIGIAQKASGQEFYVRSDYASLLDDQNTTLQGVGLGVDFGPLRVETTAQTANALLTFDETYPYRVEALDYEYSDSIRVTFDIPTDLDLCMVNAYADLPDVFNITPFVGGGFGVAAATFTVPYLGEVKTHGSVGKAAAGLSVELMDHRDAERFAAQQRYATISTVFRVRWFPAIGNIAPETHRIVDWDGRVYNLLGRELIGRNEGALLPCEARGETV